MTQIQLLEKRIDAVAKTLQYPHLSDWAVQYWNNVLDILVMKLPKDKLN
tara:strand:- start:1139 stop:1285 length:147 start_codon:yes stop_codon:yes gene_type:complete